MNGCRIDHLHLRSPDPESAARFYEDAFGATIRDRVQVGAALRVIVDLGGTPLFIEQVSADTPPAPVPPFQGVEHIGVLVPNMAEAVAELKGKGVRFTMEPKELRPGISIAFLQGPDGVIIEILQRG